MTKLVSNSPELTGKRKTVSVYMTAREHRDMVRLSKRIGLSYSAVVRRLVAAYADGSIAPRNLPKLVAKITKPPLASAAEAPKIEP